MARRAIPEGATRFDVPSVQPNWTWAPQGIDHQVNLGYFVEMSRAELTKAENGRRYGQEHLESAFDYQLKAREYAKFFKLSMPRFPFLPHGKKLEALRVKLMARFLKAEETRKTIHAKREAAWAERRRIEALELPEKIEKWREHDPYVHLPYWWEGGALLRISKDGKDVETSRGARFPVEHAVRGLRLVQACVNSKREYVRNGHSVHLGHYVIDKIDADGTVHAGCHVVSWEEIQRIAPELERRGKELPAPSMSEPCSNLDDKGQDCIARGQNYMCPQCEAKLNEIAKGRKNRKLKKSLTRDSRDAIPRESR